MNKLFSPNAKRKDAREWMVLKKSIDKDTILWTKLNQRAYQRLKIYKNKAKVIEIIPVYVSYSYEKNCRANYYRLPAYSFYSMSIFVCYDYLGRSSTNNQLSTNCQFTHCKLLLPAF